MTGYLLELKNKFDLLSHFYEKEIHKDYVTDRVDNK